MAAICFSFCHADPSTEEHHFGILLLGCLHYGVCSVKGPHNPVPWLSLRANRTINAPTRMPHKSLLGLQPARLGPAKPTSMPTALTPRYNRRVQVAVQRNGHKDVYWTQEKNGWKQKFNKEMENVTKYQTEVRELKNTITEPKMHRRASAADYMKQKYGSGSRNIKQRNSPRHRSKKKKEL